MAPWPGPRDVEKGGDTEKIPDIGDRRPVQILTSPLASCVTWAKSLHLLPRFLICKLSIMSPKLFGELREMMYEKQVFTDPLLAFLSFSMRILIVVTTATSIS